MRTAAHMATLLLLAALAAAPAKAFTWMGGGWWGLRASYSLKWYTYNEGGRQRACNFFAQDGRMAGIEFGVPVTPRLHGDWGVATGVFFEVYSCKNDADTKRIEDFSFYLPVHAMWRHRFNSLLEMTATTGPALNVGILQKIIDPKDSTKKGYRLPFDDGTPRRVNVYWEAGASLRVKVFEFGVKYGIGLTTSDRFLSSAGSLTHFRPARPQRLAFTFGLFF